MVTSRVDIGILVSGNTYRPPALLAKEAVTIDHISNGRVIIGLGAGWHEPEHRAYGFFLPSPGERVSRFAEALQLIKALMTQERATFPGRYYQLDDAPFEPRPVRPTGIPITVGTSGPRMLGLVARYADRWNMVGSPEQIADAAAPPGSLREGRARSGRDRLVRRRLAGSRRRRPALLGEFYRDLVGRYREAGVSEVICQWQQDLPLDALERIAAEAAVLRGA